MSRAGRAGFARLFGVAALLAGGVGSAGLAQAKGLDAVVGAAIKSGYAELHRCYRKLTALDRSRGGTVFVEATLGRGDRVAGTKVVRDEVKDNALAACLASAVARWKLSGASAAGARPGNTIVIPLTFRAPRERPAVGVGDLSAKRVGPGVQRRALLTRKNAGATRARMALLAVKRRLTLRAEARADRALVVLAGRGAVRGVKRGKLRRGSSVSIPAGRSATVVGRSLELLLVRVPLGRNKVGAKERVRVVNERRARRAVLAGGKLRVTALLDRRALGHTRFYLGRLRADKGVRVPEHMHLTEAELLYLARGGGPFHLEGRRHELAGPMGIYIPEGKMHAMKVTSAIDTVQVYAPAGPEQRFFKKSKK